MWLQLKFNKNSGMTTLKKILVAFGIILLTGCGEDEIQVVGLKGTLKGNVFQSGSTAGLEKVTVKIEGTDPMLELVTDTEGRFIVPNLRTGTYNFIFTKPGYGTYKVLGHTFVGGETDSYLSATLWRLPEFKISALEATITESFGFVRISGDIFVDLPDENSFGYFRYYLHNQSDISPSQYSESDILDYYYSTSVTRFSIGVDKNKYPPGSNLYMIVYPCMETSSSYLDLETGNKIYSSIATSGSAAILFTVPL